jgi:hypothetical protein
MKNVFFLIVFSITGILGLSMTGADNNIISLANTLCEAFSIDTAGTPEERLMYAEEQLIINTDQNFKNEERARQVNRGNKTMTEIDFEIRSAVLRQFGIQCESFKKASGNSRDDILNKLTSQKNEGRNISLCDRAARAFTEDLDDGQIEILDIYFDSLKTFIVNKKQLTQFYTEINIAPLVKKTEFKKIVAPKSMDQFYDVKFIWIKKGDTTNEIQGEITFTFYRKSRFPKILKIKVTPKSELVNKFLKFPPPTSPK